MMLSAIRVETNIRPDDDAVASSSRIPRGGSNPAHGVWQSGCQSDWPCAAPVDDSVVSGRGVQGGKRHYLYIPAPSGLPGRIKGQRAPSGNPDEERQDWPKHQTLHK